MSPLVKSPVFDPILFFIFFHFELQFEKELHNLLGAGSMLQKNSFQLLYESYLSQFLPKMLDPGKSFSIMNLDFYLKDYR